MASRRPTFLIVQAKYDSLAGRVTELKTPASAQDLNSGFANVNGEVFVGVPGPVITRTQLRDALQSILDEINGLIAGKALQNAASKREIIKLQEQIDDPFDFSDKEELKKTHR